MSYLFIAADATTIRVKNFTEAALGALKGAYGDAIPDGGKAGVIRQHKDGRRFWVTVNAKSQK